MTKQCSLVPPYNHLSRAVVYLYFAYPRVLYLLIGDSEGLGKIRREELEKSSNKLGIKDIKIIDDM